MVNPREAGQGESSHHFDHVSYRRDHRLRRVEVHLVAAVLDHSLLALRREGSQPARRPPARIRLPWPWPLQRPKAIAGASNESDRGQM